MAALNEPYLALCEKIIVLSVQPTNIEYNFTSNTHTCLI